MTSVPSIPPTAPCPVAPPQVAQPQMPPAQIPQPQVPQAQVAPPQTPRVNGRKPFSVVKGITRKAWKLGIYGPEGVGKSSLAASCPGVMVADLEYSMADLDVAKVQGISNWMDLRTWVQQVEGGIICIDSMTRAEDWCALHIIKNKKSNENQAATDSIEDFKYKTGLTFVLEEFRRLLSDLDAACQRGVSIVMVAHNRVNRIKNPDGSDFIRHEPRLMDDPKGSNMLQWVQFCDHVAFIDLDKHVQPGGKVQGGSARTIKLASSAVRISKARLSLAEDDIVYERGSTRLWELLGAGCKTILDPACGTGGFLRGWSCTRSTGRRYRLATRRSSAALRLCLTMRRSLRRCRLERPNAIAMLQPLTPATICTGRAEWI